MCYTIVGGGLYYMIYYMSGRDLLYDLLYGCRDVSSGILYGISDVLYDRLYERGVRPI